MSTKTPQKLFSVLDIRKSQQGNLYIKVTDNAEIFQKFLNALKEVGPGANIMCTKKADRLKQSLERGFIDQAKYDDLVEKLSFIKYEGDLFLQ